LLFYDAASLKDAIGHAIERKLCVIVTHNPQRAKLAPRALYECDARASGTLEAGASGSAA
jgi:hypothetical protein